VTFLNRRHSFLWTASCTLRSRCPDANMRRNRSHHWTGRNLLGPRHWFCRSHVCVGRSFRASFCLRHNNLQGLCIFLPWCLRAFDMRLTSGIHLPLLPSLGVGLCARHRSRPIWHRPRPIWQASHAKNMLWMAVATHDAFRHHLHPRRKMNIILVTLATT
jgi:hypothetical protein